MSKYDEIELNSFRELCREADRMEGDSLVTRDEAEDFVSDTLEPEDVGRVNALLDETPEFRDMLIARRSRVREVLGAVDEGGRGGKPEHVRDVPVMIDRWTHLDPDLLALSALTCSTKETPAIRFPEAVSMFLACADHEAAQRFFARLVHPTDGIWLTLCRDIAAGDGEQPERDEVAAFVAEVAAHHENLGCEAGWRAAAALMYDCAAELAAAQKEGRAARMGDVASAAHELVDYVEEVTAWLTDSAAALRVLKHVHLPVALCEPGGRKAHIATLNLELLEAGTGALFSAPCMALLPLDAEFRQSLVLACDAARAIGAWSDGHDVRWSLAPPDGIDVTILMGGSLGWAALYGITHLAVMGDVGHVSEPLAGKIRQVQHPERVCFARELGAHPADGIVAKSAAALEDKSITVMVGGPNARKDVEGEYGPAIPHAPNTWQVTAPRDAAEKLTLVLAATLDEAVEAILVEQEIFPVFAWWRTPRHMAKVKRQWIKDWITGFRRKEEGRIALLLGPMGGGKTSFLANYFTELTAAGDAPVAHFIDLRNPGSDDPKSIMRSLCAQVCRKHRLPHPVPSQTVRAWSGNDMLAAAQQLVTSLMNAYDRTGRPEVLFIDGVDEAFGEGARFYFEGAGSLPDLLRAIEDLDSKWKSVRLVASSRDSTTEGTSHLANLKVDPKDVLNLGAKCNHDLVMADLVEFFKERLDAGEEAAREAATAAEGSFLFARLCLKQQDSRGGIDELLDRCIGQGCGTLAGRLHKDADAAGLELITALGLLAVMRAPLTADVLADLLGQQRRDLVLAAINAVPEFFEDGVLRGESRELRWLHSYIPEFIIAGARDGTKSPRLKEVLARADAAAAGGSALQAWHAELGMACMQWHTQQGAAGSYGVRHLLAHFRHARLWDLFACIVTHVGFLRLRLQQPDGCRDLVKSLHRMFKQGQTEVQALPQRPLMKMIFNILVGLNEEDAKDWLHVFQELHNQMQDGVANDFLAGIEAVLTHADQDRVWLRSVGGAERRSMPHAPLPHPCGVLAVAFSRKHSRSGQWLVATAGVDSLVRVWKPMLRTHKDIDPSLTHRTSITSRLGLPPTGVAFLPSLKYNLVTLWNGIRFIQADLRQEHPTPDISASTDPTGAAHSLAVPADCDLPIVAAGYSDGSVQICDADYPAAVVARLIVANKYGIEHGNAQPLANTYGCIAISPDGCRIAVALPDQHVRIWRLDLDAYRAERGDRMWKAVGHPLKAEVVCELPAPVDRRVDSMAWSPDGRILAIGGGHDRGVVELWDIENQSCTLFNAHQNSVWALAWLINTPQTSQANGAANPPVYRAAPTSSWILISGSYDRTFALWSYDNIRAAKECEGEKWERPGYIGGKKTKFHFITRHAPAPLAVRAHPDVVLSIAVSPDQSLIATAGGDHEANVWEVEDLLGTVGEAGSADGFSFGTVIHAASISLDGDLLATASDDGYLRFWDMQSKPVAMPIHFGKAAEAVQTVKFAPEGLPRALLVGTERDGAYLCELNDDNTLRRPQRRFAQGSITSVAFNLRPGARHRLAIGHDSGDVTIYDAADDGDALELHCPLQHSAPVRSVAFSPIAPVLATVGNDKIVIIWNFETGECFKLPMCHQGRIKSAAFSPDGRWLATGGRETIRLWDTATWSLEETINAHNDEIWTLEWSPCGSILASGAKDKTVRLWNMNREHRGPRKIASLPCSNSVVAIWFSEDSKTLHVADPGPERTKPACTIVEIRGHISARPAPKTDGLVMSLASMKA